MINILFPAVILSLTACAPTTQLGVAPEKKTPLTHVDAARHLSSWNIKGAVAAKNNRKAWTASLDWTQQTLNQYQLRLFGPLGGESILIEKNGRILTYQDATKRITTTDIDELFYKETGLRVPIHNLYYWVRGIKAPGSIQASVHDQTGHLVSLTQGGYTIRYENYQTIQNIDLPTKLQITGSKGQLKLIIKQWKIH